LCERQPTALQRSEVFLIFDETGVHAHDINGEESGAIKEGTWALTDSHPTNIEPCQAFYWSSIDKKAWIVQATSPATERWTKWRAQVRAHLFVMDCFSLIELRALGLVVVADFSFL
jgi:hypothetical protein